MTETPNPVLDPRKSALYEVDLSRSAWRKASASGANAGCFEVTEIPGGDGAMAVRDSHNPDRPHLVFNAVEWAAARAGFAAGEL